MIAEKVELVRDLQEMSESTRFIDVVSTDGEQDPADELYARLKTEIAPVEKSSPLFKMVQVRLMWIVFRRTFSPNMFKRELLKCFWHFRFLQSFVLSLSLLKGVLRVDISQEHPRHYSSGLQHEASGSLRNCKGGRGRTLPSVQRCWKQDALVARVSCQEQLFSSKKLSDKIAWCDYKSPQYCSKLLIFCGNNRLFPCSSRLTNYCGILKQGLRIAPPEAPVTGYMVSWRTRKRERGSLWHARAYFCFFSSSIKASI